MPCSNRYMSQVSGTDSRVDAVGGSSAQSGMTVDPLLMSRIRTRLSALGLPVGPAIVLFDLTAEALHVAAVDAATGQVAVHLRDRAISAAALDRGLADYLVAEGAIARPTTRAWARELVALVASARRRLVDRSSTSVAGSPVVGVVHVDRDAADAAFAPLVARSERLGNRAAVASPLEVTSAVLTAEHPWWPGLSAGLAAVYGVPVVTIDQPAAVVTDPQRYGHSVRVGDHASRDVGPMTGDHDRVAMPLAHAYSGVSGAGVDVDSAVTDELDVAAIAQQLDTDRFAPIDLVATEMFEEPPLDPAERAQRRRHNRNVLLGATAAAAVMIGGAVAITSPSWSGEPVNHSTVDQSVAVASTGEQPPQTRATPSANVAVPTVAPDTAGATAPVVQFTPAPPKPPVGTGGSPRGRKPTLVLPNPLPGQPPIVIPPLPFAIP